MARGSLETDRDAARRAGLIEEVGARLRRERKRQGLTLQHVARAAGLDHSHLSNIERGRKHSVPLLTIARITTVLALPLWKLFLPETSSRMLTLVAGLAEGRDALHRRVAVAQRRLHDGHAQMVEAKILLDEARMDHAAYVAQVRAVLHDVS